jgi:hypothetical protein
MAKRRRNLGGFSLNRALGVTRVKGRVSRATGIPLTRSGRQRKVGSLLLGQGCLVLVLAALATAAAAAGVVRW